MASQYGSNIMPDVPYIHAGSPMVASDWQTLWQEADGRLAKLLNNQSVFLTATGFAYSKAFFFGTAVVPPTPLTTMAQSAMYSYAPVGPWNRIYDDTMLTAWVNDTPIDSSYIVDPAYEPSMSLWAGQPSQSAGLVRLAAPVDAVRTALETACFPEALTPYAIQNFLDLSLRVHKKLISGSLYNVCVRPTGLTGPDYVEHEHWWEPIDVVLLDGVGSSMVWPIEWDKYRLLRFNNLQTCSVSVNLEQKINWAVSGSGTTVVIQPMQSVCARATSYGPNRGWVVNSQNKYFPVPLSLDPWWRSVSESNGVGYYGTNRCNITDPMNCAYMLASLSPIDATKAWDARFVYYGSGIGADANHIATPSGSWFGSLLDLNTKLGDLLYHKGQMVAIDRNDGNKKKVFNYNGINSIGSDLSFMSASVNNDSRNSNYLNVSAPSNWDLITLSTNLLTDALGKVAVSFDETYYTPTCSFGPVNFMDLDGGIFSSECATLLVAANTNSSSTDYHWPGWAMTGWTWWGGDNSFPQTDGTIYTASLITTTYTADRMSGIGPWNIKDTTLAMAISDIENYEAGSIINTASPKATIFGPGLLVNKFIDSPLYPIDGLISPDYKYKWSLNLDISGSASFSTTIFAPFGYQLGDYVGYSYQRPSWPHYTSWHYLENGTLNGYFPRTRKAIARARLWDEWPNVMGFIKQSVAPYFKSFFEQPPFDERYPVALSSDPLNGIGTEQISGSGFLGKFNSAQTPEMWQRFCAWVTEGKVFRCPPAGDFIEDFVSGSDAQIGYYAASRDAILNGNPVYGDGDALANVGESDPGSGKTAIPVMPMLAEHYNACASVVNGFTTNTQDKYITTAQDNLLYFFESHKGFGVNGIGARPRNQYVGWDETAYAITAAATAMGFTVLTDADLPSPWGTAVVAQQGVFDGSSVSYDDTGSLMRNWAWPTVASGNYRWITIEDAQAVYAALGAQFVLKELVCPAKMEVVTADRSNVMAGTGGSSTVYEEAVGWYNDIDGDWVYTPDGYTTDKAPIRSDVSRTDYTLQWNSAAIYRVSYGALDTRLYAPPGGGPTQAIVSNQTLLYRRYGSQLADAIIWPRNYCDYDRDFAETNNAAMAKYFLGSNAFGATPRRAVNDLEGQQPELVHCTGSEQIITTGFENAVCVIWPLNTTGSA